jgi:hypothetical protein
MTKREVLLSLSARQDQLIREIDAAALTMTLSSSHQVANVSAVARIVSSRLREIAKRPDMERELQFVEPV